MPVAFIRDDLMLALCREAFKGEYPIDITTTVIGATTGLTAVFGQLAFTTSGATSNKYHDIWIHLRRLRGTATAGASTTIDLESGHTWAVADGLKNGVVKIVSGTGLGQERNISSNTTANPSVVTVSSAWDTNPSTDSLYEIYPTSFDSPTRAR